MGFVHDTLIFRNTHMRFSICRTILMALVINGSWCSAQSVAYGGNDHLQFQHVTAADGLSDNGVTCIFEDAEGYIWIGTERGLNRFDGQRIERFTANGPSGAHISAIAQDSTGTIWVATTDGGLSEFDRTGYKFIDHPIDTTGTHGIHTKRLNHLLSMNDSILFLCSQDKGLIRYNTVNERATNHCYFYSNAVKSDTIPQGSGWYHSTTWLDRDRIWLGLIPGGNSYVLNSSDASVIAEIKSTHADSSYTLTTAIAWNGDLLAGGWGPGISRISLKNVDQQQYYRIRDEVTAIAPWPDGSFIIGTKINGLEHLNRNFEHLAYYHHDRRTSTSLLNDRVRCILKDRAGTLWVGTANGISYHVPGIWSFKTTPLFGDNNTDQPDLTFHKIQQDEDCTIRISTSHGFFKVRPNNKQVKHVPLHHNGTPLEVTGLFTVFPDRHFLGTETGYFKYDIIEERIKEQGPVSNWVRSGVQMYQVRAILPDTIYGEERMIVNALGYSIASLNPNNLEPDLNWYATKNTPEGFGIIRNTQRAPNGRYWSATPGGVISWSKEKNGTTDSTAYYSSFELGDRKLPGSDAKAIVFAGDTAWVALRDAGLAAIINDKAIGYPLHAHISGDPLGITIDTHGIVWCTSSNGLLRFDPRSSEWSQIKVNDGSMFEQLTSSITTLDNGDIAFCANNTLLTFNPSSFTDLPAIPQPLLFDLHNNWGPLPIKGEQTIELSYRNSAFDATISALHFGGAVRLRFLYRLNGLETAYRSITANTPLRYSGVPVGQYELMVRVLDPMGRLGPEHKLLSVHVKAPIWQKWWFYAALVILAGLLMWQFFRFRLKQTMRLQSMRDHIARDLHDDVGSTLGSISFYSEALKRKLDEIDDPMAKDVASRIGNSSRDMIDRMADIVWSVDPKNDDAGSLIARMKGYASDLVATRGIELKWNTPSSLEYVKLGTDHRRNLFMIFKEAVYNSVKYAACTQIHVTLNIVDRKIELKISDNGKGFDPENVDSYNGNGLPGMQIRAKAMGGQVSVQSSPGNGTTVIVVAPINTALPRSGD